MSEHEQWDIVSSVGLTALVVAAARAVETHRPDGLIEDPWGERFVAAVHPPIPLSVRPSTSADQDDQDAGQVMSGYLGVRTRWFDEALMDAVESGIRQVVILAAGLDARAQRLPWPAGTTVYEVDQPRVLEFKDGVLAAHGATTSGTRRTVPVDLRDDWASALLDAGFDPDQPTAWLTEGLLPYLPGAAQDALLATIDKLSAPGSRYALEDFAHVHESFADPAFARVSRDLGFDVRDLVPGDERADLDTWLTGHGWAVQADAVPAVAAAYGRTLEPVTERVTGQGRFVIARR